MASPPSTSVHWRPRNNEDDGGGKREIPKGPTAEGLRNRTTTSSTAPLGGVPPSRFIIPRLLPVPTAHHGRPCDLRPGGLTRLLLLCVPAVTIELVTSSLTRSFFLSARYVRCTPSPSRPVTLFCRPSSFCIRSCPTSVALCQLSTCPWWPNLSTGLSLQPSCLLVSSSVPASPHRHPLLPSGSSRPSCHCGRCRYTRRAFAAAGCCPCVAYLDPGAPSAKAGLDHDSPHSARCTAPCISPFIGKPRVIAPVLCCARQISRTLHIRPSFLHLTSDHLY